MKLVIAFTSLISFGFNSSLPQDIDVKLSMSPTFEKLTLKISSENNPSKDYQFKVVNAKGKEVKWINLSLLNKNMEAAISIEDLEIGEYSCSVIKDQKQVFKGRFIKDWFDADFY
jgi:hypothetical protein